MSSKRWINLCLAATTLVAVSGCLDPTGNRSLDVRFAQRFSDRAGSPVLLTEDAWWERFQDPQFTALANQALAQNLTLDLAQARVRAAREAFDTVPSSVTVDSSVSAILQDSTHLDNDSRSDLDLGFDWLFDPWGQRDAQKRSRAAALAASEADAEAARLLVLLSLGEAYVNLRYTEEVLQLRHRITALRRKRVSQIQGLVDSGEETRIGLLRAQSRLANSEISLPTLRATAMGYRNEIAVLAGSDLSQPIQIPPGRQPRPHLSEDIGVPADLLRNRPDVVAAEWRYRAALANIDDARADLYPRISLGGFLGADLISSDNSGLNYGFGPTVIFPVFPAEAGRAEVRRQDALAEEAWLNWKITVIESVEEVETSLAAYAAAVQATHIAQKAVTINSETADVAEMLFAAGEATQTVVDDAEDDLTQAQEAFAAAQRDLGRAFVSLNVQLGAGSANDRRALASPGL